MDVVQVRAGAVRGAQVGAVGAFAQHRRLDLHGSGGAGIGLHASAQQLHVVRPVENDLPACRHGLRQRELVGLVPAVGRVVVLDREVVRPGSQALFRVEQCLDGVELLGIDHAVHQQEHGGLLGIVRRIRHRPVIHHVEQDPVEGLGDQYLIARCGRARHRDAEVCQPHRFPVIDPGGSVKHELVQAGADHALMSQESFLVHAHRRDAGMRAQAGRHAVLLLHQELRPHREGQLAFTLPHQVPHRAPVLGVGRLGDVRPVGRVVVPGRIRARYIHAVALAGRPGFRVRHLFLGHGLRVILRVIVVRRIRARHVRVPAFSVCPGLRVLHFLLGHGLRVILRVIVVRRVGVRHVRVPALAVGPALGVLHLLLGHGLRVVFAVVVVGLVAFLHRHAVPLADGPGFGVALRAAAAHIDLHLHAHRRFRLDFHLQLDFRVQFIVCHLSALLRSARRCPRSG